MCDFKKSTESVGLKFHPEKTNILSNQGLNKRKEETIDNIIVEGFASERDREVPRTNNNVRPTRDNRNQESYQSSMGIIYQV